MPHPFIDLLCLALGLLGPHSILHMACGSFQAAAKTSARQLGKALDSVAVAVTGPLKRWYQLQGQPWLLAVGPFESGYRLRVQGGLEVMGP